MPLVIAFPNAISARIRAQLADCSSQPSSVWVMSGGGGRPSARSVSAGVSIVVCTVSVSAGSGATADCDACVFTAGCFGDAFFAGFAITEERFAFGFAAGLRAFDGFALDFDGFAPDFDAFLTGFLADAFFAPDFAVFLAAFLDFVAFFALAMAETLLEVGAGRGALFGVCHNVRAADRANDPLRRSTAHRAAVPTRPLPPRRAYAAFSSDSSAPSLRQSHSMQRKVVPRFVSFLSTNLAWHTGHGCGMGLSQATKSQPFFAQFEQP